MKRALFALAAIVIAAGAPAALAQDQSGTDPEMAARFDPPPPGWQVPRTQWGDPDLRGVWPLDYLSATPRERPGAEWGRARS